MGYTHYFTQTRSFNHDEWAEVSIDLAAILSWVEHGLDVPLANGAGDRGTHPELIGSNIMFNGVGDNAHETMVVHRTRQREWDGGSLGGSFCKTARKPYDIAVTACLCYLSSVTGAFVVSSDGNGGDFLAGLAAARSALPNKANILDIPMRVMQDDRWTGPWISHQGSKYHVRFCINGKGYVIANKTGEAYCFATHGELGRFLAAHKQAAFRWGGNTHFGGYSRIEADIWHASGSFDQARIQRIQRVQTKVLDILFPVDAEHAEAPPAYVRPNEFVRPEDDGRFCYSLGDLLRSVEGVG